MAIWQILKMKMKIGVSIIIATITAIIATGCISISVEKSQKPMVLIINTNLVIRPDVPVATNDIPFATNAMTK